MYEENKQYFFGNMIMNALFIIFLVLILIIFN